jgi:hypothetical protein
VYFEFYDFHILRLADISINSPGIEMKAYGHLPVTQSGLESPSNSLHSSVHQCSAVGILFNVAARLGPNR